MTRASISATNINSVRNFAQKINAVPILSNFHIVFLPSYIIARVMEKPSR